MKSIVPLEDKKEIRVPYTKFLDNYVRRYLIEGTPSIGTERVSVICHAAEKKTFSELNLMYH